MGAVTFSAFKGGDALAIALQPSQWIEAGIEASRLTPEGAAALEASGAAWTARDAGERILCCAGFAETFAGRQATAWAWLAADLGVRAHLAVTRFARARIAESPLRRIESLIADTAPCRKWASAVGLALNARLECWGADSGTVLLYARVRRGDG